MVNDGIFVNVELLTKLHDYFAAFMLHGETLGLGDISYTCLHLF